MTIKELREYFFSGTTVNLCQNGKTVLQCYANELQDCPYADHEINAEGIHTVLHDGIIRINISEPPFNFPREFDSEIDVVETNTSTTERVPAHVVIIDRLTHHYTWKTMYHIRVEFTGKYDKQQSFIDYRTVSEEDLLDLYNRGLYNK
jgi:hypothetical protein